MDIEEFKNPSGKLLPDSANQYYTFVPDNLPVKIDYDNELLRLLSEASTWLGRLDGAGIELNKVLHNNVNLFIRPQLENEAVESSRIEGTLSSLDDMFKEQAGQKILDEEKKNDILEVRNYIRAQETGINLMNEQIPIDLQLITKLHSILLQHVRGEKAKPGSIREVQNYISHYQNAIGIEYATYIPPLPERVKELLSNMLDYMDSSNDPILVKIALMHYQFEAIHPFLDGNGRIGRLLLILYLIKDKALKLPLLYMSDYFEKNRSAYYSLLRDISKNSTYSEWLKFFLIGVISQSKIILDKISKLSQYYNEKGKDIEEKYSKSTYVLFQQLFGSYIISANTTSHILNVTYPTAKRAIDNLIKEGVIQPLETGKARNQLFVANGIREIYKE